MISESEKKKYINAVSRNIRCGRKAKAGARDFLSSSIEDAISQNEDMTIDELKKTLGEPEEMAKSFSESIDPIHFKKHKRFVISLVSVISVLFTAVLIWLIIVGVSIVRDNSNVYYVKVGPAIYSEETESTIKYEEGTGQEVDEIEEDTISWINEEDLSQIIGE